MHPPSANASPSLSVVITATKKLGRPYHLTHDQMPHLIKEVRRALAIAQPKSRTCMVAHFSRQKERKLMAHTYRMQGTRGFLSDGCGE